MDTFKASADALEETAKTAGKVIDASRDLGGWLDGRLSKAIDDVIGLALADKLAYSRAEALIRRRERLTILARQSKLRLEALGVNCITVPQDKVLAPLLEAASLEDDPTLQEMWANLLATAMQDDTEDLARVYVSILTSLSPVGALAFKDYILGTKGAVSPPVKERGIEIEKGSLNGDNYGVDVARELFRLGLVEPAGLSFLVAKAEDPRYADRYESESFEVHIPGDLYRVKLTDLARRFAEAVGVVAEPSA